MRFQNELPRQLPEREEKRREEKRNSSRASGPNVFPEKGDSLFLLRAVNN